jgi:dienelactone hydrolase
VANAVLCVVHEGGHHVPPGVTGELPIGGLTAGRCGRGRQDIESGARPEEADAPRGPLSNGTARSTTSPLPCCVMRDAGCRGAGISRHTRCRGATRASPAEGADMAEVLLFHHSQGLTSGVRAFAEALRAAGHTVHVPDLYAGRVFADLEAGVAHAQEIGFGVLVERGRAAADELPAALVYAGFSLGVLPAQSLAQTRPGARGALLFHSCVPTSEFGGAWPEEVPVQVHGMEADEFFVDEGDLDAARALVAAAPDAELFLYPGKQHLFVDSSLPSYDEQAAALLTRRVLGFLDGVE